MLAHFGGLGYPWHPPLLSWVVLGTLGPGPGPVPGEATIVDLVSAIKTTRLFIKPTL